jgi:carbamoylphosphate synthase small subunit
VPGGSPSPSEDQPLDAIERDLVKRLGTRGVLAAVITTGEMRESVIYTPTDEWIGQFHRDLEASVTTHEVQVMAETDPGWSMYKSLAEG